MNFLSRLWLGMAVVTAMTASTGCANKADEPDSGRTAVAPPADPASDHADSSAHGPAQSNELVASASSGLPANGTTTAKPVPWGEASVATVNNRSPVSIPMAELIGPLIEAHGLDMLLNIVQRDLAKQGADTASPPIVVTSEDFKAERERTLNLLFRELDANIQQNIDKAEKEKKPQEVKHWQDEKEIERQQLLKQFYEQKHLTATDFNILIQTNTYLRKIAEPKIEGKITEEMLHAEFAARFGEKVRVRHIQLKRPQDVVLVKRRLAAGEKFEDVARELSTNRETGALGGELLPFNREAALPKVFKDVAFDLKVGQVSDLVNADDTYHLIKLEERIMPKAVVFEQQRDILYRDVQEQMVQSVVAQLRRNIANVTRESLKVSDPVMNKQLQERLDELNATAKGKEAAEQEMAREHDRMRLEEQLRLQQSPATSPTTTQATATQPAAPVATRPVIAPSPPVVAPPVAPAPIAPPAPTRPSVPATDPAAAAATVRATTSATRPE